MDVPKEIYHSCCALWSIGELDLAGVKFLLLLYVLLVMEDVFYLLQGNYFLFACLLHLNNNIGFTYIMNNQSSTPSFLSRAIDWITLRAIQPVKNIFAPNPPITHRKHSLKYSNIAKCQEQSRVLGLKYVREGLVKGGKGDRNRNIGDKIKKISQYWGKKMEQQQRPLELICPICMDFLVGSVSTKCGHTFCWQCIDEASLMNQGCPVCRRQIQGSNFTLCLQLQAIVKRYLKKRSSVNEGQNEINYEKRVDDFEQWISTRLLKLCKIRPSDLVDIRDTQNIWCSGLIKQVMRVEGKAMLLIHYIGWSSIYDQILPIQSQRLATYRLYSSRKDIPHYQLQAQNDGILQGYVVQQAPTLHNQEQASSQQDEQQQGEQFVELIEFKEEQESQMPSSKALNCFYNPEK